MIQVSAAVAQVDDPERIWQRNVETTRGLGVEAMRRGVEACKAAEEATEVLAPPTALAPNEGRARDFK